MAQARKLRKRPCRICRKWFTPNPRLGDRQKTCGSPDCKRKWHAKKCAEWNRNHEEYFRANYLAKKLAAAPSAPSLGRPSVAVKRTGPVLPRLSLGLPRSEIQEVIGVHLLVILEYFGQLLLRRVQEVMPPQPIESQRESERLPP